MTKNEKKVVGVRLNKSARIALEELAHVNRTNKSEFLNTLLVQLYNKQIEANNNNNQMLLVK